MANNYCMFSETIDDLTSDEAAWLTAYMADLEVGENGKGFDSEMEDGGLWVYSEGETGSGDIDQVIDMVQKFLKKFRPDRAWVASWAFTCSRPIVGEFGGGAVVITATDTKYVDARSWASQECSKIDAVRGL